MNFFNQPARARDRLGAVCRKGKLQRYDVPNAKVDWNFVHPKQFVGYVFGLPISSVGKVL